ncbi:MAG TPA: prepilin-type N-terminal cleavage/methylation domain-containing protein [Thermoanaerobaculia bacterium]|jgi:prepilin-type N-terminal cleavage/methylation domain-containing protein|nr:prepilin-type N-terminal cleavage/methylation domain-containing protein [Thermoanaerobaculia bacterium]
MRGGPQRGSSSWGQTGFVLIELLIAMVLLLLALALAAQLLMESAEQLVDSAGDQADPTVPQFLDRLRGDVLASSGYAACDEDELLLSGHPAGLVLYQRTGGMLHRAVFDADGTPRGESVPWRGVTAWSCEPLGGSLLRLDVEYQAWAWRRSLGPAPPAGRGPKTAIRGDTLFLTLRGAGLGDSW